MIAGPDSLCVHSPIALHAKDLAHHAQFTVSAGDRIPFVMTWQQSHLRSPKRVDAEQALRDTETAWTEWVAHCHYDGEWREAVIRSLATLEGAHLRADRRNRRRGDNLAARGDRWRTQLGLPLLLAARRHDDPASAALCGLH